MTAMLTTQDFYWPCTDGDQGPANLIESLQLLAALFDGRIFPPCSKGHDLRDSLLRANVVHLQGTVRRPAQLSGNFPADTDALFSQIQ
jgi:hypothetical protein